MTYPIVSAPPRKYLIIPYTIFLNSLINVPQRLLLRSSRQGILRPVLGVLRRRIFVYSHTGGIHNLRRANV